MAQKFDELKQKIQNADKSQISDLTKEFKTAKDNGEIDENERKELVDKAKKSLGGGLGL